MKLADYLKTKQITYEKFSEMSGIPYNTLVKHVHKQRIPSQNYMKKYYQLTNGMVTPSDFFDIVEKFRFLRCETLADLHANYWIINARRS